MTVYKRHLVQAAPWSLSQWLDSLLDFVEAYQIHQIDSIQQPNKVVIVPLANHLKPGRIIWQWVTREGRRRLYLAIVPNIFGPETGHTFFLHVQDTRLSKEPLVSPSAVAVTVDVFEVVLECSPVLWAIQMSMNFLVLLAEFFD